MTVFRKRKMQNAEGRRQKKPEGRWQKAEGKAKGTASASQD
jgi:hypothetical protein